MGLFLRKNQVPFQATCGKKYSEGALIWSTSRNNPKRPDNYNLRKDGGREWENIPSTAWMAQRSQGHDAALLHNQASLRDSDFMARATS